MLTPTHRVRLDLTTWSRLWPLFLVAAMAFLVTALTLSLRGSAIVYAAPPARPSLPVSKPRSHTPEADSPPPRHTVRD
jgi:hypothetical protein